MSAEGTFVIMIKNLQFQVDIDLLSQNHEINSQYYIIFITINFSSLFFLLLAERINNSCM